MKIIVGLGNPGPEYQGTRHNSGQLLVDQIFSIQYSIFDKTYGWRRKKDIFVAEFPEIMLVKTAGVFMNESGKMVNQLTSLPVYRLDNLYVAHDDLDIRLGEYKIQSGTGPKEHNGVNSIERALGTKDFWRIRIGIDNREPDSVKAAKGEEYVLGKLTSGERIIINEVLDKIIHEISQANN
jgi:PTH1 family peptidyl-tRNA hydrolase